MKKILITGGSGFIGTNMVEYYLEGGLEILNIDIVKPLMQKHELYWKECDINNTVHMKKVITAFKPTHIIHLAAGTGMDVSDISHFKTNFDGVQSLINTCDAVDTTEKVVFTSSLLVCARSYIPSHDEDFKPDCLYGESKVLSEKIIRKSNMNAEWAIVRPTAVWGPWFRSSYTTFFNLVKKGLYINPGLKRLQKPANYVGNTIYMMDKILDSDTTNENVYYLADYPEYSIQEWASAIAKCVGNKEPNTVPKIFIDGIAKIGDILKSTHLISDPPLTTFRLKNIVSGVQYDLDNTTSVVGSLPYNLNDGVASTIDWMNHQAI